VLWITRLPDSVTWNQPVVSQKDIKHEKDNSYFSFVLLLCSFPLQWLILKKLYSIHPSQLNTFTKIKMNHCNNWSSFLIMAIL
jgi:hypothetical protein